MTPPTLKVAFVCLPALLGLAHAHAATAQGLDRHMVGSGEDQDIAAVGTPRSQSPAFERAVGAGVDTTFGHGPSADRRAALAAAGSVSSATARSAAAARDGADEAG